MAEDTRSGEAPLVSGADIRTFLFADFRGYTRYTPEHGDEAASVLASRFAELVRETVPEFEGELLELRGDEALCVFGSARQALRASVDLQRRLRTPPTDGEFFPLGVGMGLDAGEAVPTESGYRGGALNVAARFCASAKPGQILATDTVVRLAGRIDGLRLVGSGRVRAKGVDRPLTAWTITPEDPLPPLPPSRPSRPPRRVSNLQLAALSAVVVLGGVLTALLLTGGGHAARAPGGIIVHGNSLAEIDPVTGRVVADVPVNLGGGPSELAIGNGYVWTYAPNAFGSGSWLYRVQVSGRHQVTRIPLSITPNGSGIVTTPGEVWVADPYGNTLTEIDANSLIRGSIPLKNGHGSGPGPSVYTGAFGVSVGAKGIYVAQDGGLVRVNPHTRAVTSVIPFKPDTIVATVAQVASSGRQLWIASANPSYIRLREPKPLPSPSSVRIASGRPNGEASDLASGFGYGWYAIGSHVWQIDPSPVGIHDSFTVPGAAGSLALSPTAVWAADNITGTLLRINPNTDQAATFPLHRRLASIAAGDGAVWVAVLG